MFLVKEHLGIFKAANNYDIYEPSNGEIVLECREENLGFFTKLFRFTKYKTLTPFHIEIKNPEGQKLLTIKRGVSFFVSEVMVYDENDNHIGGFKQKFFSIGGKFNVLNNKDEVVCLLKGKWTGWDFKFILENEEFARVTKKWNGLGKELFTSADNYVLEISEKVPENSTLRKLILSAVMCIDMVLKER
ncbi:MAG: phospholipid scramblase-related protein [Bacteroidales bacterium]